MFSNLFQLIGLNDRVDTRNFRKPVVSKFMFMDQDMNYENSTMVITDSMKYLCAKPTAVSTASPAHYKALLFGLVEEVSRLEDSMGRLQQSFNSLREEKSEGTSPDHSMKLSFDDRLAELSESFNEANFADAMNGVIFMDLGGELLKVRKEIDMVIMKLEQGVVSMSSEDCAITKAPLYYILRCPEWNIETGKQFELVPEHFGSSWGGTYEPRYKFYTKTESVCQGSDNLDSEFQYLLPLECCNEIEAKVIPYSCPLMTVYQAPNIITSDLLSVVSNPSGETVSVECRDQDPKVPREDSFSIVSDCAIRVGNSKLNGQGAYIQSGFKWTTKRGIEVRDVASVSGWVGFSVVVFGLFVRLVFCCYKKKCASRERDSYSPTAPKVPKYEETEMVSF